MARQHKAIPIKWGKERARIDEALAPIILELWKRGIQTNSCCQGGPGSPMPDGPHSAYVEFADAAGAQSFVNAMVAGRKTDPFYRRVTNIALLGNPYRNEWEYLAGLDFRCDPLGTIRIGVSISFPPSDIPEIVDRLQSGRGRKK